MSSGPGSTTLLLTAVTVRRTARCTDTVVFSFSGATQSPGVHVSIAQPPFTLAGSGATVTVRGDRFYKVQFEPASTFDLGTGRPSYTGSTNITPTGTAHVRQLVETDSFEGVVTWIIGVGAGDQFFPVVAPSPPSLTLTF